LDKRFAGRCARFFREEDAVNRRGHLKRLAHGINAVDGFTSHGFLSGPSCVVSGLSCTPEQSHGETTLHFFADTASYRGPPQRAGLSRVVVARDIEDRP